MRDKADNVVIICSIENFDPMGVHTGDSITVAPAQTLTDKEYQRMRDAAHRDHPRDRRRDRRLQHPVRRSTPTTGDMIVIEMNPRVSRVSRAGVARRPASRSPRSPPSWPSATGSTSCSNDITRETPACFEPTIDYVVTKVPRWAFEKFPDADPTLTTQMKSVGETMAIGRTFKESLQKALRGLETGRFGLGCDRSDRWGTPNAADRRTRSSASWPRRTPSASGTSATPSRPGMTVEEIHQLTQDRPLVPAPHPRDRRRSRTELRGVPEPGGRRRRPAAGRPSSTASPTGSSPTSGTRARWRSAASARRAASRPCSSWSTPAPPSSRRTRRTTTRPTRRPSPVARPPHHPQLGGRDAPRRGGKDRIMILGGGPNRIGQGIEFDYCCCQAAFALREAGLRDHHGQLEPGDGLAPTTTPATTCSSSR